MSQDAEAVREGGRRPGEWRVLSDYCIQHRGAGSNVCKVHVRGRYRFVVWYKRARGHDQGPVYDTKEGAMAEAAKVRQ